MLTGLKPNQVWHSSEFDETIKIEKVMPRTIEYWRSNPPSGESNWKRIKKADLLFYLVACGFAKAEGAQSDPETGEGGES